MYIYIYISNTSPKSRDQGVVFDLGVLFIDETVRSSRSCDGSQQAGSNTAIDSFWRYIFVKI